MTCGRHRRRTLGPLQECKYSTDIDRDVQHYLPAGANTLPTGARFPAREWRLSNVRVVLRAYPVPLPRRPSRPFRRLGDLHRAEKQQQPDDERQDLPAER